MQTNAKHIKKENRQSSYKGITQFYLKGVIMEGQDEDSNHHIQNL